MYVFLHSTFQLHSKLTHCWTRVCMSSSLCYDTKKSFLMFVQIF